MKTGVRKVGEVAVVTPVGDIKIGAGAEILKQVIQKQLDDGARKLVLDLGEVGYVDSSGLGEMVACLKRTAEAGGDLKLANRRKRVSDLFVLTRLETVFDSYPTVDDAVASFR